jgi:oligo-1,6-glucosidase
MRKENRIIVYGDVQLILPDDEQIFAYMRTMNQEALLVILNFCGEPTEFVWPAGRKYTGGRLLLGNYRDVGNNHDLTRISLRPYEARVYQFSGFSAD